MKTSNGSITVQNVKDKKITIIDGSGNTSTEIYGKFNYNNDKSAITLASTFTGSLKADDYATTVKTINGAGVAKAVNIVGNDQNNTIIGGSTAETIYGDAGADSLNGGEGNDVIADFTSGQDTIKLVNGTITKTSYSGNNVIFTVGSGSVTVQNGKGKKITITDSKNKTTTQTYTQDVSYANAR